VLLRHRAGLRPREALRTTSSPALSPRSRRLDKLGNPLEASTHVIGPMAQARFADLIREQKAEALRKGATVRT
jgi:hypothetical protein